jgi:hypothetical protein
LIDSCFYLYDTPARHHRGGIAGAIPPSVAPAGLLRGQEVIEVGVERSLLELIEVFGGRRAIDRDDLVNNLLSRETQARGDGEVSLGAMVGPCP